MNKEGWMNINTNKEDNRAIKYDYGSKKILLMIVNMVLMII